MDRAEAAGLGVATAGHVALFAALSLGVAASIPPKPKSPPAMDVSFIDDVALESAAPVVQAPAAAEALEVGTPVEAMPQPAPAPEPLPKAPEPVAAPAPPPRPEPVRQPKPQPVAAKPRPEPVKPKPEPAKRVVAKPDPAALARAKAKVEKARSDAAKLAGAKAATDARAKAAAAAEARKNEARLAAAAAAGKGKEAAQKRKRLGDEIRAGIDSSAEGKGKEVVAAVMSDKAKADIGAAIKRQVDPCAKRQALSAPGVERIKVTVRLQLNRDGSLAARPAVTGQTGVDDENSRYARRVNDLAIAAFTGCAPLRGLPADLYDVKRGWKTFSLRFSLPARG